MKAYIDVIFNLPVSRHFTYVLPDRLTAEPGQRVQAPFGSRKLTGYIVGIRSDPPAGCARIREIERIIDPSRVFDEKLLDLAHWVSTMYMCSPGEALAAMLPGGKKEKDPDYCLTDEGEWGTKKYELAPQQISAIGDICSHREGAFYLHGVTGSGKTDVYIRTAEHVLGGGRDVIYLVPEISLTHQVSEILLRRFGDAVAIVHSGLTPSQRLNEWMRILSGRARFVVGARSAVFAPVSRLGLIIVDEEHEGAYKSSSTPRYHARQVAMHRCTSEKALLIMGSATPSLEAYYRMKEGKLSSILLPERLSGGRMPAIEIVDMKHEKGPLSGELIEEIKKTHDEGRQTILFLNRRGFAYYFHCRSCGYEMKCKHCSVSLTFHKQRGEMVCHYCGYKTRPVEVCPECKSLDVGYSGFGTEKIEEEMKLIFPDLIVRRIDTDAVRKKRVLRTILSDFRQGKIDVLLGTQMVAKGLNFPKVKLVGIISADTALNLPDFRASERTFSLIVQVSGRAGRSHPDGKVIVQTIRPDSEAIRMAVSMRCEEYYETELDARRELEFPPFVRLIRIVFRGKDMRKTRAAAKALYSVLDNEISEFAEILGPAECPISIISANYRYQLIFRSREFGRLHRVVKKTFLSYKTATGVYCEIDVDPVSLL
ncbi:MAG: primosomal protein N' [Spirochaetales bacterium]|nr:primosomal protein N' [Spirochaetales bacterium]